jgi:serine/threonine protein kinase
MSFDPGEIIHTRAGAAPPAPSIDELAPHFAQLEILGIVGQGGAGTVYRARQRTLGRYVALKVLSQQYAHEDSFAARFEREARALASLSHPHIVMVHDAGRAGPYLFLLMEFVEGTNLRGLLRLGRIDPRQALSIVSEVCSALQYAHDRGVVHRDIKPENVLLDVSGRAKIADFGLAKLVNPDSTTPLLTTSHQVMGTPQYMAPEQIERPSAVDHRADLYALGVVLYELLTGELPMGRFDSPSQKTDVDVRLDAIVLRALERDRERRYQHAAEIKTDVDAVSSGRVIASRRASPEPARREPETRASNWIGHVAGLFRSRSPDDRFGPAAPAIDRGGQSPPTSPARASPGRRVTLVDVGLQRAEVARVLQEVTRCSRAAAWKALEKVPIDVVVDVDESRAQWVRARMEAFGADVEIE